MKKQTCLLLLLPLLLLACDQEAVFNCEDCYTTRPVEGELKVQISRQHNTFKNLTIQVYQGKTEEGILLSERNMEYWIQETYTFELPLNQYYSCRCIYTTDEGDFAVIDGTFFKAKKIEYLECDTDCWTISGGSLNGKFKD